MTVLVSVVVPTYRRPEELGRCLEALLTQEFDPDAYEVIVVDDAGSEETRRQVEELAFQRIAISFQTQAKLSAAVGSDLYEENTYPGRKTIANLPPCPAIHYLATQGTHGPAAARNLGWRSAQGEIIAFTDDDTIPQPGWLAGGMEALSPSEVAGASGQVIVPIPDDPHDNEWDMLGLSRSLFITANCFYRRSALEDAGGFDERFTTAWREDSDLFFSLLRKGCLLVEAPQAVVIHPVRKASWGASLKAQKKSQFNALLFKKHPELYRKYIQARPPWKYYGILGSLVGALLLFANGQAQMAEILVGAWAGITLGFTSQRLEHTSHKPAHILEMLITSVLIPPLSVFWRLVGAVKYKVWFV